MRQGEVQQELLGEWDTAFLSKQGSGKKFSGDVNQPRRQL